MAYQQVDFSEINNPLCRFLLDDGTEIAVKLVLMRVVRTDKKLSDGQYQHEFQLQHVIDQIAPAGPIDMKKLVKGESK